MAKCFGKIEIYKTSPHFPGLPHFSCDAYPYRQFCVSFGFFAVTYRTNGYCGVCLDCHFQNIENFGGTTFDRAVVRLFRMHANGIYIEKKVKQ